MLRGWHVVGKIIGWVWLMCRRCIGRNGLLVIGYRLLTIVILVLVRGHVAGNEDKVLRLVFVMYWLMILCAAVRKHLVCWLLNLVLHRNGDTIR